MEATVYVPHAILFVYDIANENVEAPEHVDNVLTACNGMCLSVGTQAEVDGEVTVRLCRKDANVDKGSCSRIFQDKIHTPGKKISIATAEFETVLEMDVDTVSSVVSVWVDDRQNPSIVMIEVG
jgi:hypothetical protein